MSSIELEAAESVISGLANTTARVISSGGIATTIAGVFDRQYVETLGISGERPTFTALTSDMECMDSRGMIVIDSIVYRAAVVQPDGAGITTVILEERDS